MTWGSGELPCNGCPSSSIVRGWHGGEGFTACHFQFRLEVVSHCMQESGGWVQPKPGLSCRDPTPPSQAPSLPVWLSRNWWVAEEGDDGNDGRKRPMNHGGLCRDDNCHPTSPRGRVPWTDPRAARLLLGTMARLVVTLPPLLLGWAAREGRGVLWLYYGLIHDVGHPEEGRDKNKIKTNKQTNIFHCLLKIN